MKVNYCFLERFNNYFNRKLIKYSYLEDYTDVAINHFIPMNSESSDYALFDFNPNDNITTEIIVNDVPFDPDYFLILDPDDESIMQRWFVLEQKRNRKGQWTYFLKRDVLADSLDNLKTAPMFVEKGMIMDTSSPLLMNNEDVRVNQIKKKEILLKDRTECAWLVLYVKKGLLGSNHSITVDVPQNEDFVYEKLTTPITSWQYYQYSQAGTNYKKTNRMDFRVHFYWNTANNAYIYKMSSLSPYPSSLSYTNTTRGNLSVNNISQARLDASYQSRATSMINRAVIDFNLKTTDPLSVYHGKIIKDSDGKYWKVYVTDANSGQEKYDTHDVTSNDSAVLKSIMTDAWRESAQQPSVNPNDQAFQVRNWYNELHITLEELTDVQTTIDFNYYEGTGTKDSCLFDAICMPYGDVRFYASGGLIDFYSSAERSLRLMNSIATQLTSEWVLDFQILPYCPTQDLIHPTENKRMKFWVLKDTVLECIYNGDVTDLIIVCGSANFTFDLQQRVTIDFYDDVPESFYLKFVNDCTKIRLCSPNYCGVFEMNLAKNGGQITKFNVDMTLRPFNPYIHVNPDFNFLYGQDFNDQRGLVCGGDFSLGIINDAWNVYEIQNKNYQAIFDRQIQNLDVNNAIARQEAGWGAVAGTVQGTASGAITGGMTTGSPYGAIAGAVVGGVASGIGGAMDIANLQKRQQEARSYAIDNYNLQLGNIQALPYSITKTSALTYNNKLFPFVEIYECTEVERLAYYEKLWFNGMTIGIIDKIEPYLTYEARYYFRAKVIRIENLSEDNHYFEAINEELTKGVFI